MACTMNRTPCRSLLRAAVAIAIILMAMLPLVGFLGSIASAQSSEPRIAFVVGNGGDARAPLPTAVNDAGLVAEALRSIGFDVVEGADLNHTDFSREFRQFLARVERAGQNAIAVIYISGYGFAFDGDNFFVMADARLERGGDIPLDTVRMSDLMRGLGASPARAKVVIADVSRKLPFALQDVRVANGLSAIDPPRRTLIAYSDAPGLVASDAAGPYGAFAAALAEMLRSPGVELGEAFARIRARTHQATQGRQTPWDVSALAAPLVLDGRRTSTPSLAALGSLRERRAEEAYAIAIRQDTLASYGDFLSAFPRDANAPRVRSLLRARREALVWQHAVKLNSAASMWTYLQGYPKGLYVDDAQRRLRRLAAPPAPPADFAPIDFPDVPAPLPDEPAQIVDVEKLPPPPAILTEPQPAYLATLPAPAPRVGARVLPTPVLPPVAGLTAGKREPLASVTGLPGIAGPVATNASQSIHTFRESHMQLAGAATAPAAAPPSATTPPLPVPAPLRAAALERSRHQLANRPCRMRRGNEVCRTSAAPQFGELDRVR
jgi:uncharacterized caspase-like protein